MKISEHEEQVAFIEWCDLMIQTGQYPELDLIYSIVNERRGAAAGAKAKAQGQKAGMPDLHLPMARGGYIGLYMELKVDKNRPTKAQRQRLAALGRAGHMTLVCYGWDSLRETTEAYLALPPTEIKNPPG